MPTRRLGSSLTAAEVCDALENLITPHALLRRARKGLIPGAFKIGHRVYFSRNTAAWLVTDLSPTGGAGLAITVHKECTTVDGYYKPPR
jgi:hypothetical protein